MATRTRPREGLPKGFTREEPWARFQQERHEMPERVSLSVDARARAQEYEEAGRREEQGVLAQQLMLRGPLGLALLAFTAAEEAEQRRRAAAGSRGDRRAATRMAHVHQGHERLQLDVRGRVWVSGRVGVRGGVAGLRPLVVLLASLPVHAPPQPHTRQTRASSGRQAANLARRTRRVVAAACGWGAHAALQVSARRAKVSVGELKGSGGRGLQAAKRRLLLRLDVLDLAVRVAAGDLDLPVLRTARLYVPAAEWPCLSKLDDRTELEIVAI